jgi:hypothetical protein
MPVQDLRCQFTSLLSADRFCCYAHADCCRAAVIQAALFTLSKNLLSAAGIRTRVGYRSLRVNMSLLPSTCRNLNFRKYSCLTLPLVLVIFSDEC